MAKDTSAATPATAATAAPKRTRTSFSKEKKFGFLVLGLLEILKVKRIAEVLTDEQKAKIAKAADAAKAIGAVDPFKEINDRMAQLQKDLEALKAPINPTDNAAITKYVATLNDIGSEMNRQQKRKAQIEEMLGR